MHPDPDGRNRAGGDRVREGSTEGGRNQYPISNVQCPSGGRGRRTEDRGQGTGDRRQETEKQENRKPRKTGREGEARGPRSEVRYPRSGCRGRRTEGGGINIHYPMSNVQVERSYREGAEEQPSPATNSQVGEAGRGRPAPGRRRGSGRGGEVAKAITGTRGGRGGRGWRRGRRGFRRGGWGRQSRRSAGAVRRSGSCRCSCSPWRGRGRRCRG